MDWFSALAAAALFAAACNLDTVLLSAGVAARGVVLRRGYGLVIAALTTLITWLSLALGALERQVFNVVRAAITRPYNRLRTPHRAA